MRSFAAPIRLRPIRKPGAVLVCFLTFFSWLFPPFAPAQMQTFPCETVSRFSTGMSAVGAKLQPGLVDPSFEGIGANFEDRGAAYVVTDAPAIWLANSSSADSQWIGPSPSVADDVAGTYLYRLRFTTPCAGAQLTGRYAAADRGALRLNNSVSVSFPTPATGAIVWTQFFFDNLPAGANTLEFSVTNAPGRPDGPTGLRAELTVTATCCPCIALTCPSDIFLTTCSNGATANFSITGTNRCYTNLTINCSLAAATGIPVTPGTVFPVGTNNVICNASDTVGHRTNCAFRVVVTRDTRPPEIECPSPIVYLCRGTGTNVFYQVTATDDVDLNPSVTCVPPSGSFFASGTNRVDCQARDACGNIGRCSFPVIIAPNGFVKTLQAGVADSFNPGSFEPATVGPCLPPGTYWSGMPFDESWPGRYLSHSFQGLPSGITAARLILQLQPTQPASQDDELLLGLQNCGPAAAWLSAKEVASLPGTGGVWSTNPPTTFALDLAALPGGANLLAEMNATHRFDFAVGTETRVDYARLEVTYCGPQALVSGVPYSMDNVYPIHRRDGVSWRTVNSNGPPPTISLDVGAADGMRFDFGQVIQGEPGLNFCQLGGPLSHHHGFSSSIPTGQGSTATLSISASSTPGTTRISLSQPLNLLGKSVDIWNGTQQVTRYFLPGTGDTAVEVDSDVCLTGMGFLDGYFFASFGTENPFAGVVPIKLLSGGQHISGQVGTTFNGDLVRFSYRKIEPLVPKEVRVQLPPGGLAVSKVSLHRGDSWIHGVGPRQITVSDAIHSLPMTGGSSETCLDSVFTLNPEWSLELNGTVDFCTVNPPLNLFVCHEGYLDVKFKIPSFDSGSASLRLTPTALPFDDCHMECLIGGAPFSLTVNRMVGGPITLNNVSAADFSNWPLALSGELLLQDFGATLPANTVVTVGAQTFIANGVTFHRTQTSFLDGYSVCLETKWLPGDSSSPPNLSFKSFTSVGASPISPDCLTLSCPTNVIVNCTNGGGTVVTYTPIGVTRCGSNVVMACVPPSGSVFPPGISVVSCTAIDSQANQDQCRFLVTVQDVSAPQLVIPARIIVPCTGPRGAVVEFSPGATDTCDPSPVVICTPPSGSTLPVGTNYVTCSAIDAGGNRSSQEFPVIVTGGCGTNRCVDITVPTDVERPCNTAGGAVVTFAASARNTCTGGTVALTCTPPSGSLFAVGLTRVICSTSAGVNDASATFLVEITDVLPPRIHCPSNVVVAAQSPLGALVAYAVSATDDCTPQPRIVCVPPSGSALPVGDTAVFCEAADREGNTATCNFVVTVRPPPPFTAARLPGNRVELRWVGDATVESTDALNAAPVWRAVAGTPTSNGVDRTLVVPIDPGHHFFRIVPRPLLPAADRDGDGVLDENDRCPETPPGLPVDDLGCSSFDLIATPDLALGPEQDQLRRLHVDLTRWPSVGPASVLMPPDPGLNSTCNVVALTIRRDLPHALLEQSNVVRKLDATLIEFRRLQRLRSLEIDRTGQRLDAEHADVRNEDHELAALADLEQELTDSLSRNQRAFLGLSNVVRATGTVAPRQRVRIQSIDSTGGFAMLADGRRLLLPKAGTPGALALESIVDAFDAGMAIDADISVLPDGSSYANAVSTVARVSSRFVQKLDPRVMALRVTPADPRLPEVDVAPRHHLKAYKFTSWATAHHLEFGQALAAVRTTDPRTSDPEHGNFDHWLVVDGDLFNNGTYYFLASMTEKSEPFVLRSTKYSAASFDDGVTFVEFRLPGGKPFNLRVREYRRPSGEFGDEFAELLGEEIHQIQLKPRGSYASATYDRTVFDLEDESYFFEKRHGVARVNSVSRVFPLTLKPISEMTFSGRGYRVVGNGSSYPEILSVGFNEPIAVHRRDPNDEGDGESAFAKPAARRGIVRPILSGFNQGKKFSYGVTLPRIVRDRLHDCPSGPDTYYRIPLRTNNATPYTSALAGVYSVRQGNNSAFGHHGFQAYAYDFAVQESQFFRRIHAARGGWVVEVRENFDSVCWEGTGQICPNCSGGSLVNHVKIRHQDGTEAWYGPFEKGAIEVSENPYTPRYVRRGTSLGPVGLTACSGVVHWFIHFHVVNEANTTTIPVRFESSIFDPFNFGNPFHEVVECYSPLTGAIGKSTQ